MTESEWQHRVEQAALTQDHVALRALYDQARELFGDDAPHRWSTVLSAFDALAVTG